MKISSIVQACCPISYTKSQSGGVDNKQENCSILNEIHRQQVQRKSVLHLANPVFVAAATLTKNFETNSKP